MSLKSRTLRERSGAGSLGSGVGEGDAPTTPGSWLPAPVSLDHKTILAFPTTRSRGNGEITVTVTYTIPIVFPGYTYNWHLVHEARNPIF